MMANIKNNAFIIGSSKMWIVNCATSHKGHFVGSCQNMKLSSGSRDVAKWKKVQNFILKFANPGSVIRAYSLADDAVLTLPGFEVQKEQDSLFQLPGCTIAPTNGIKLPDKVSIPVVETDLQPTWVPKWSQLQDWIKENRP